MYSKVLYELLLKSYNQFLSVSETWKFTLHKNGNEDLLKSNHPRKFNQSRRDKKNITFKTDLKSRLGALKQKLWAF